MISFSDITELRAEIETRRKGATPYFIGVEGASFSGKSSLARRLAAAPRMFRVSTDCYHDPARTGAKYTDGLDLAALQDDLAKVRGCFSVIVIEGICLSDTLHLIAHAVDVTVYCKRISPAGVWNDDPDLSDLSEPQSSTAGERVDYWSAEYHARTRPHERATYIFERVEKT